MPSGLRFTKVRLLMLLLAVIFIIAVCNYLLQHSISNLIFKSTNNTNDFLKFYEYTEIEVKKNQYKLYNTKATHNDTYFLYIPSNYGSIPANIDAIAAKYQVFTFEYPKHPKQQTAEFLKTLTQGVLNAMNDLGIKNEDIVIFGQNIGANIALEVAQNTNLKSIIMLNPMQPERQYCEQKYSVFLCLLIKPTFFFHTNLNNVLYYFYTQNSNFSSEQNYHLFNLIDAKDKILFEIPGENLDFNFNHILDFYENETIVQEANMIFEEITSEDDDSGILNVDGYTDPDAYFD